MSKKKDNSLTSDQLDWVIRAAWHDYTSFEAIRARVGLPESEVIRLMRSHLKPKSFQNWRKRVNGRLAKHRKRSKADLVQRRGEHDYSELADS